MLIFIFLETSELILSSKKEFGMDNLEISKIQFSQIFALKSPLISKTSLAKLYKVHGIRGLFRANYCENWILVISRVSIPNSFLFESMSQEVSKNVKMSKIEVVSLVLLGLSKKVSFSTFSQKLLRQFEFSFADCKVH